MTVQFFISLNVLTVTPCFCLKLKSDLMVEAIFYLLNSAFAMAILHLISLVRLASYIILLHKLLKYYTVSRSLLIPFVWDVTPRCWVGGYRRFERTVRLYHQGFKVRELRNMDFESLMMTACCFKTSGTTYPVTQCHIPGDWNSL